MLFDVNVWTWWFYHLTCAAHLKKYWGCLKECASLSSKNQIPQRKLEREWFPGTQWKSLETMFKLVFNLCFSVVEDTYSNQQARLQCIYSYGKLLTYLKAIHKKCDVEETSFSGWQMMTQKPRKKPSMNSPASEVGRNAVWMVHEFSGC